MNSDGYTIVRKFVCQGKEMVIVKLKHGTHIMDYSEWCLIYEHNHKNKWYGKTD